MTMMLGQLLRLGKPKPVKVRTAIMLLALTIGAGSAWADAAGHQAACTAAFSEAQGLQRDLGVWRAEARVLAAHRSDPGGLPARLKPMSEDHRKQEVLLNNRMSAASNGQFALHRDGACPEDAQIAAAMLAAAQFENMQDAPKNAPLPEGYCRNSPDMSAPLVPCPKRPTP